MLKRMAVLVLLSCYCYARPCAAQIPLEGDWIGGVDYGRSWQYINLHFKSGNQGIVGTVDSRNRVARAWRWIGSLWSLLAFTSSGTENRDSPVSTGNLKTARSQESSGKVKQKRPLV